jgi:hypothetical protein
MSDSRNATLERELRDRAWLNEKELDLWEAELRRVQRNGDVILPPGSNCLVRMARHALESMQSEIAPPTADEIAAYRDLFRAELDKRMDTNHPSASPSTEAHEIALRRFVEGRNKR